MTDHYAVMGNPIAHSKSPFIHKAFAEQTGQDLDYIAIQVEHGDFENSVKTFLQSGGKGLNITVPFKNEAFDIADKRSDRAERAGAVNTFLLHDDGLIEGDNTDGVGLVSDLANNHGISIAGQRILVLGAGGAVQGVLQPLLDQAPAEIMIANRTVSKATALAERFADAGNIHACGFDELQGKHYDGIINGTAASLQGEVPPLPAGILSNDGWAYDMMYGAEPTAFMAWASANNAAKVLDGLGMLVEQAAESFYLWRGLKPDSKAVIAALREALGKA